MSTASELLPITEKVLALVARLRKTGGLDMEDVRRIELCALATREAAYLQTMYPAPADTVNVDTLVETVDNARRSIAASLIAVKGHLDKPYPDNPRWTPWTRFVERELRRLDEIKEVVSDLAARAREKVPAETLRRIQELEAINAQMTRHRDRLARRVAELEQEREAFLAWKAELAGDGGGA